MGPGSPLRFLVLVSLMVWPASAQQTQLDLEFGWGDFYRPAAWTPVFVTLSDARTRNVMLEINTPGSGSEAMVIRQNFAIGPQPATFPLLVPLDYNLPQARLRVWDMDSEKKLAETFFADPSTGMSRKQTAAADQPLIGVSGRGPAMQTLQHRSFSTQQTLNVGYLEASRLPESAEGYTSLDLLALNQPNLAASGARAINRQQQQAIVDWVSAGGNLIIWFDVDPLPDESPIVRALPCKVGPVQPLETLPAVLRQAGLGARYENLQHRALAPIDGAELFPILPGSGAMACQKRVGFGNVIVLSLDASSLHFDSTEHAQAFWERILARLIEKTDPAATTQPNYWQNTPEQRRAQAVQATMDLLGDIPGVGSFGFSYVAIVLIGLMLVVGPVDWFVLKKLNRQPWTWVTTTGWIALVTSGAVYIGHVFKSGDLHLRTMRLIDQAGGQTVASVDFVCVYSPRTADYELKLDERTWYRPPDMGRYYYSGRLGPETPYRQDMRGSRPETMRINVWNLRFVEGEKIETGPAVVEAELRVWGNHLQGSIINRSNATLKHMAIRTRTGITRLDDPLAAGATIEVDRPIAALAPNLQPWQESFPFAGLNYLNHGGLAITRRQRADEAVDGEQFAIIYAESEVSQPQAALATPGAKEHHWRIIRALVRLKFVESKP